MAAGSPQQSLDPPEVKPAGDVPRNDMRIKERDEDEPDGQKPEEEWWHVDERERAQEAMKASSKKPKQTNKAQIQTPSVASSTSSTLSSKPPPPSSGAKQHQKTSKPSTPPVATYAPKRDANTICYNCKQKGHTPDNCNYLCQRCGQREHAAHMCRGGANYAKATNWLRRKQTKGGGGPVI